MSWRMKNRNGWKENEGKQSPKHAANMRFVQNRSQLKYVVLDLFQVSNDKVRFDLMLREKLDLSSYLCLKWVTGIFIWQYDLTVGFAFKGITYIPLKVITWASSSGLFEMWMLPPTEGLQACLKCSSAFCFSIPDRTQTALAAIQKHSSFDKLFCFQNVYLFFKMRYFKVLRVAALKCTL